MTTGTTDDRSAATDGTPRQADGGPRVRASDADRAATVAVLQDAVARGLLTHDEGAQRMGTAFATRFLDELPLLTADLPPAPIGGTPPRSSTAPGWRDLAAALVAQVRHEVSTAVAAGPRSRRFLATVAVAVVLLGVLVLLGGLAVHGLFDGGPEHFGGGHRG